MSHPQNKHQRMVIGMKKGIKRAHAHWGHERFESFCKSNRAVNDPDLVEDYVQVTKIHRDTTTTLAQTRDHNARIGEKAEFKARKAKQSLKNLDLAYEPIKVYELDEASNFNPEYFNA